jgi:parvulin-like peptidyl-prolyl isomerase
MRTLPILVTVFASSLAGAGIAPDAAAKANVPPPPAIFARVGDSVLTTLELSQEVSKRLRPYESARKRAMAAGQWGEAQQENFEKLKQQVTIQTTRMMMRDALIEELVHAAGIRADEVLIEMRIKSAAKRLGGIDKLAKTEGRSMAEIRAQLKQADVTRRFYRAFVPQGVPPTPAEIREYYNKNLDQMKSPDRVGVSIITIPYGTDRKAAFERVESLRRELQFAPQRFALRAKESSSHETKNSGGVFKMKVNGVETDLIPANMLPKSWLGAIARLRPGRVSPAIPGTKDFALLKLDKVESGGKLGFADAADRIAAVLTRQIEQEIVADWSDYYLGKAYIVGVDLEELRSVPELE